MIPENHTHRKDVYYQAGLTRQFRTLRECLDLVVHSHQSGVGRAAAAVDMRPSELSEALRGINGRRIDIDMLDPICAELNDFRPLDWWIEKRKEDDDERRARQLDEIDGLLRTLSGYLEDPDTRRAFERRRRGEPRE